MLLGVMVLVDIRGKAREGFLIEFVVYYFRCLEILGLKIND